MTSGQLRGRDDDDVQRPRAVHTLDPVELDVTGCRGTGHQRQGPVRIESAQRLGHVGGDLAVDNAHRDHQQILGALRARDALPAASAATVHITAVEQWLATSLTDAPEEPLTG